MTAAAPTRRQAITIGAAVLADPAFAQALPVITLLGDSITAGYGPARGLGVAGPAPGGSC